MFALTIALLLVGVGAGLGFVPGFFALFLAASEAQVSLFPLVALAVIPLTLRLIIGQLNSMLSLQLPLAVTTTVTSSAVFLLAFTNPIILHAIFATLSWPLVAVIFLKLFSYLIFVALVLVTILLGLELPFRFFIDSPLAVYHGEIALIRLLVGGGLLSLVGAQIVEKLIVLLGGL